MTLAELNQQAFKTLMSKLGYINAVRFFKQFETGSGDYSKERQAWLDSVTLEDIWRDTQDRQSDSTS